MMCDWILTQQTQEINNFLKKKKSMYIHIYPGQLTEVKSD